MSGKILIAQLLILAAFAALLYTFQPAMAQRQREVPARPQIGNNQFDCDYDSVTVSSPDFVPIPNTSVSIDNGAVPRNVILQFSAESSVSTRDARMDLRYSIDSGRFQAYGPEFLHQGTRLTTRNSTGVAPLPPGFHTIVPGVRVTAGGTGTLYFRCLTAEGRTR